MNKTAVLDGPPVGRAVVKSDDFIEGPTKPRLRGVSHEVAGFVFPLMGVAAVLVARSLAEKAAVGVYTVGVSGMYATSACYHALSWAAPARARALHSVWRRRSL
jgi:hemolysin III